MGSVQVAVEQSFNEKNPLFDFPRRVVVEFLSGNGYYVY